MLAVALILAGYSSHRAPPPDPRLVDSITVVVNLNEQLHSQHGAPYCYSDVTPRGVNCSGFAVRAFHDRLALQLLHETRERTEIGTRIDKRDLLPGDPVLFKTGLRESSLHVGICDTDNQLIHASTSQGVARSSLDNAYWNREFWQARRIWRCSETGGRRALPFFMPIALHPAHVSPLFEALH